MDSISQIVLGAAIGEAVLGKKLGNKAMFWGAVGGTIPDLDIITSPLMSEVDSLAFHRGISHSFTFAILGGALFGYLAYSLYKSPYHRHILSGILALFLICIPTSIFYFLFTGDNYKYQLTAMAIALAVPVGILINKRLQSRPKVDTGVSLREWVVMFFLAFATHSLLDTFTMYGTQLFLPFSNVRAAISSISVADPFGYTIPFIVCLLVVSRFAKDDKRRTFWNYYGIGISTAYLLFTIWHKQKIEKVFVRQAAEQNIEIGRMITGPTIFNNLLWNATIENEDRFYQGQYSVFDTSPITFNPIEKNHDRIADGANDRTLNILRWFSAGYYNVITRRDGQTQINDLRFGTFRGDGGENDFIFRFIVGKDSEGQYEMYKSEGGPAEGEEKEIFKDLYTRIKGR